MDTPPSIKTRFDARYGVQHGRSYERYDFLNPSLGKLKELFLDSRPIGHPWGEATITFESPVRISELYVLSHPELGYFLRYGPLVDPKGLLSCWDRAQLSQVECPDDLSISAGLFVPSDVAFQVVEDFVKTGEPSPSIEWITPDAVPPDGNYV